MKKFKKAITAIIVTAMLASAFSAIPFTANAVEVNVPKVSQSRDATNYVVTRGATAMRTLMASQLFFGNTLAVIPM